MSDTDKPNEMDIVICGRTGRCYFIGPDIAEYIQDHSQNEPVPADNETRKAMEVGRQFISHIPDDMEYSGSMVITPKESASATGCRSIIGMIGPKQPAPLVGVEWLKSLPVGTRIMSPNSTGGNDGKVIIARDALLWPYGTQLICRFTGKWEKEDWCEANCPTWEPQESDNADDSARSTS
jgi:hypothetical protein